MPNKTVTTKSGVEKNIIANTQEELDEAVKVATGEESPTYPNIDVPVAKGHDLVEVQGDLSKELIDGTGAHNSPRNAVKDDGSAEGNSTVPGVPQSIADKVPSRIRVGESHEADIASQLGQEQIRKAEEAEAKKSESADTKKSDKSEK